MTHSYRDRRPICFASLGIGIALIACMTTLAKDACAQAQTLSASIEHAPASASGQMPAMPDGLYMTKYSDAMPFLLVDKGQWIDPYIWTQKNGIDALNKLFVNGRSFQEFHVNSWRDDVSGISLQRMEPKEFLTRDALTKYGQTDVQALMPGITDGKCKFSSAEGWKCTSTSNYKHAPETYRSCSTSTTLIGCGTGIVIATELRQSLTRTDPGFLKIDKHLVSRQIAAAFNPHSYNRRLSEEVSSDTFLTDAFYGPQKQKLVSGHFVIHHNQKKSSQKPRTYNSTEHSYNTEIGFVWSIDLARFVYLQARPKILDSNLMLACEHKRSDACPRTLSLGMWAVADRLYTVWAYSQIFGMRAIKWPEPKGGIYYEPKDALAFPQITQLAIVEIQLDDSTGSELFTTVPFLSFPSF